jgi:GntR family transcriptional repressor for pyruvate dehydrogenase complex
LKAIEKVSIIDLVVKEIQDLCLSDEIAVGEKLPTEKQLCETLNVGRSTVREALRILQAMGLIETRPGRGAFLKSKDLGDSTSITKWFREHEIQLREFMEVRMALEPLAVKLAIERGTESEFTEIAEIFKSFEKAQEKRDVINLAISDEAFHNAIVKATHNQLLIIINQNIANAFAEYRTKSFAAEKTANHALEPHRAILSALQKRDVAEAKKQMRRHLEISLKDVEQVVSDEA